MEACYILHRKLTNDLPLGTPYCDLGVLFTSEECDNIVDSIPPQSYQVPVIGEGTEEEAPNHSYTNAKIAHLTVNDQTVWIYDRLANAAADVNDGVWNFDVLGTFELIDVVEYTAPGGQMKWHIDLAASNHIGLGTGTRKLNILVQLTDPDEYEGGELEIFMGKTVLAPNKKGNVIVLPSWIFHRVNPVTSGVRRSIVTYLHGHPFR
jgi:PKHD-type hydroxylase